VKPAASLDTRQWTAAARALQLTSSRTVVDFINGQSLKVSIESVRQTEKANRARIGVVLGASDVRIDLRPRKRTTKKGKIGDYRPVLRGGNSVYANSFAERILGTRFKQTGKFGIKGDTMEERVRNLIKASMRSAGFIASGWIGARNALFALVKKKPSGLKSKYDSKQYGRPKGRAVPARFKLRGTIQSSITNTALMSSMGKPPAPGGNPMPGAVRGLQSALNFAATDMIAELARRLSPDFKKVSAR
jgi:hypothetical protein